MSTISNTHQMKFNNVNSVDFKSNLPPRKDGVTRNITLIVENKGNVIKKTHSKQCEVKIKKPIKQQSKPNSPKPTCVKAHSHNHHNHSHNHHNHNHTHNQTHKPDVVHTRCQPTVKKQSTPTGKGFQQVFKDYKAPDFQYTLPTLTPGDKRWVTLLIEDIDAKGKTTVQKVQVPASMLNNQAQLADFINADHSLSNISIDHKELQNAGRVNFPSTTLDQRAALTDIERQEQELLELAISLSLQEPQQDLDLADKMGAFPATQDAPIALSPLDIPGQSLDHLSDAQLLNAIQHMLEAAKVQADASLLDAQSVLSSCGLTTAKLEELAIKLSLAEAEQAALKNGVPGALLIQQPDLIGIQPSQNGGLQSLVIGAPTSPSNALRADLLQIAKELKNNLNALNQALDV